jgi:hypothetical protein
MVTARGGTVDLPPGRPYRFEPGAGSFRNHQQEQDGRLDILVNDHPAIPIWNTSPSLSIHWRKVLAARDGSLSHIITSFFGLP